ESTRSLGQAELHSIIWGVAVPFALDTPEICGDVQPNCPLRPRDRCTYKKSIYIASTHSRKILIHWAGRLDFRYMPLLCGSTVQIKSVKMKPCKLIPCELTKSGKDTIQIKFQAVNDFAEKCSPTFVEILEKPHTDVFSSEMRISRQHKELLKLNL
ncbi:hypothetical protein X801_07215, partial [Opisthorchis viverrini]